MGKILIGTTSTLKSAYLTLGSTEEGGLSPIADDHSNLGLTVGSNYEIREIYAGPYLAWRRPLPAGYNEAGALKIYSGNAYIDTGIKGGLDSEQTKITVEVDVALNDQYMSANTDMCIIGARKNDDRFILAHYYNLKFGIGYGNYIQGNINFTTTRDVGYTVISEFTKTKQTLKVRRKGVDDFIEYGYYDTITNTSTTTYDTGVNLTLFAVNNNGTKQYFATKLEIGKCKIYVNDVLKREFIPCMRESDEVFGMYDLVEKKFYTTPTGQFMGVL